MDDRQRQPGWLVPPVQATSLRPLRNRQAEWQHRLAMVEGAREFLYLSTFYIDMDTYGDRMLDALWAACARGVAVTLLVDSFGQTLGGVAMTPVQRHDLRDRLGQLAHAGARVVRYRPDGRIKRLVGGGQHVKIQISEQGEAIFGSSNLSHSSFERWQEYSVAIAGDIAASLLESYRLIGVEVPARHLASLQRPARNPEKAFEVEYWCCNPNLEQGVLGPFGWNWSNQVTTGLIRLCDSAREEILVSSLYFKPTRILQEALLRAARRGVRVIVHHSHREALQETDKAWIASAIRYPALLAAGIEIHEHRSGEHSKMLVVDRTWAAVGSYNFEDAAHERLAEAMLVSRAPAFVRPVLEVFDQLGGSEDQWVVTAEQWARVPASLRTRVAFWGQFGRWI